MTAIALRMSGADLLKLRRKRWLVWLSLFLTFGIVAIVYAVMVIEHASDPTKLGVQGGYGPAGGTAALEGGLRVLALFFGPLVAILIGIEAGTGDASAGVFRELVVTGRSRLALFASRVPAALALCWTVMLVAYALLLLGTFLFAGNLPTPDGALILNGVGFMLLATGVLCVIAVGFASFTTSRAGAIVTLIAWQIIASPLIASIHSLGGARKGILSQAIAHFSPVKAEGGHGAQVTMGGGLAVLVLVVWVGVFLALGAWRTRTMDA